MWLKDKEKTAGNYKLSHLLKIIYKKQDVIWSGFLLLDGNG
jgi:hypothetical protein